MKFVSNRAWQVIEDVIADQRAQLAHANARIDRLMEAVARKELVPLQMPAPPTNSLTGFVKRDIPAPEISPGWFDTRPSTFGPVPPVAPKPPQHGGNRSET